MSKSIRRTDKTMRSGLRPWSVERCCNHSFIANALGPSAVVIDLGVNTGEFATWMANRFKCVVYGAEPDPDLYGELPRRCDVNVIPCAIGGAAGTAVLRRAVGKCSTLFEGSFRAESSLEVEVLDFEEFLSRAGLAQCNHIDLVKVDIEGAELPMFEDASDALLQRVGQFTVEFHDFVWPELSEQVRCVKARLHSLGFCLVNFSLDNTDVLFLNRKLLGIGRASEAYLRAIKYANGIRRRVGRFLPAMSAYL